MKNKKISICVIGSGRAGMIHAQNFAHAINYAHLTALVDPVKEVVKKASRELEIDTFFFDYKDALKRESQHNSTSALLGLRQPLD